MGEKTWDVFARPCLIFSRHKPRRISTRCTVPVGDIYILRTPLYYRKMAKNASFNTLKKVMKLISINIEEDKHLARVLPFILKELPDVLCLQEVYEENLPDFQKMGYDGEFAPMAYIQEQEKSKVVGTALLTYHTLKNFELFYYRGSRETVCHFDRSNVFETQQKAVLCADILIGDETFTIATTHFTWTPDGNTANSAQIVDMEKFLAYIATMKPHVICGDFNIPRHHNPLYKKLTQHYMDTIPQQYTSSLDSSLHRLGHMPDKKEIFESFMVDYIFTQPPYEATDVRLEFGVSDHAGIVGTIMKASSGIL